MRTRTPGGVGGGRLSRPPIPINPRIDANPVWLFFPVQLKVIARRSQSQVQDKPRKEDHFYVIAKR